MLHCVIEEAIQVFDLWTNINFYILQEANFPQASYELPFSHGKACADPLSCAKCQEER